MLSLELAVSIQRDHACCGAGIHGSSDHSSQLLFSHPRLQAGLGAAPPAADSPGRWPDREQPPAWSSQHSQDLIVASGQVGLTKARVPGSR